MIRFLNFQMFLVLAVLPFANYSFLKHAQDSSINDIWVPSRTLDLINYPFDALFWFLFFECLLLALCISICIRIESKSLKRKNDKKG